MSPVSVVLRPTTTADLAFVLTAESAPENAPFIGQWSRDRHNQACQHPAERHWLVIQEVTQQPVGYAILLGVHDPLHGPQIKRFVITQKGHGFGRTALLQILARVFLELKVPRVWLDVMADNVRAQTLYRTVGFTQAGTLPEPMQTSRGLVTLWVMTMARSTFLQRYGSNPTGLGH